MGLVLFVISTIFPTQADNLQFFRIGTGGVAGSLDQQSEGDVNGERFTQRAQEAVAAGQAIALRKNHTYYEPETLILALLEQRDGIAAPILEAADALSGYGAVPIKTRKIAVRRLVDLYETTWNLKESVRPEDKILRKVATGRYKIYGKALRYSLQALTGQHITRPHDWRRWWNHNKKKPKWERSGR